MKEKVVLAYSGGLDTSVILKWLIDKGYDVVCMIADVGQKEDFAAAKKKAMLIGASQVFIEDVRKEFIIDFVFTALKCNAIYEGKYLLGTSLARPLIAKKQIETAIKEKTSMLSHGATGKGNDQVRFELTYYTLMPNAKVIVEWREREFLEKFKGRKDMIEFAMSNGIPVKATKDKPYSTDPNIMHISYEAGVLEDPRYTLEEGAFQMTVSPKNAPEKATEITIEFMDGVPVKVEDHTNGIVKKDALGLFEYLNKIGGENGIGRADLVEDRYVGKIGRGVYETPAGTILRIAHLDIEGTTMDREVMQIRDSLVPKISQLIYNGFWYSPEMGLLKAMIEKSQEKVSGKVHLELRSE